MFVKKKMMDPQNPKKVNSIDYLMSLNDKTPLQFLKDHDIVIAGYPSNLPHR